MENKEKSLFIITSSMCIDETDEKITDNRIFQTISTVNSIIAMNKDAEIWILDASHKKLDPSVYSIFPKSVNFFRINEFYPDHMGLIKNKAETIAVNLSKKYSTVDSDTDIKTVIYNAYIKSRMEAFMLSRFLESAETETLLLFDNIYKISGRYLITDNFKTYMANIPENSFILRKKSVASKHIKNLNFQYNSILWGFRSNLIEDAISIICKIELWIDESFTIDETVVDMEHGLYKFITEYNLPVREVDHAGVIGIVNNQRNTFFIG